MRGGTRTRGGLLPFQGIGRSPLATSWHGTCSGPAWYDNKEAVATTDVRHNVMNRRNPGYSRCVGILTRPSAGRRFSGACGAFALLVCGTSAVASPVDADTHPVGEITQAAENFLEHRISQTNRRVTPRAGQLDPRLALPRCDAPLEGFLGAGTAIGSRTIVGVRCSGSGPWKVYVPVDLVEMRPIVVARRALPRGHVLSADDLVLEERDVARINGGFIASRDDVVGHRLKRQLVSGSVLAPSALETQVVVKRGQSVTLVVASDSLSIRMAGKALMDGAVDQRIRVENTVSHRIVEGVVRSPEYVEVLVR
jgi:flagellar basal body P-ring formation protein FlgA